MAVSQARTPTTSGGKYLQQLCKHWSHKLKVDFDPQHGVVEFDAAKVTMDAEPEHLLVRIETDAADMQRMQGVVARHLDRFAFKEAPLRFDWTDGEGAPQRT